MDSRCPLSGAVVCCTGIPPEDRDQIEERVRQMGGVQKLDLTSDVTHLVVGTVISEKYRFIAKYRPEVKVMDMQWIDTLRAAWIEDNDVQVAAIQKAHILPTFFGLEICLTGFEDSKLLIRLSLINA